MILSNYTLENHLKYDRLLGSYTQGNPGPTIICLCGMHGNEPSGVKAFQSVLKQLNNSTFAFFGSLHGLSGNRKALEVGKRYLDGDLNRLWTPSNINALSNGLNLDDFAESEELKDLYDEVTKIISKSNGQIVVIDLHTTSSISRPYISINDTLRNRALAKKYPLRIVLGLEEHLQGTALNYINELGHLALGFEAGEHDDPSSIANHIAIIWLTQIYSGCISAKQFPEWTKHYDTLAKSLGYQKNVYEVKYRHDVIPKQEFRMVSGFKNFDEIEKDQLLAYDYQGEIKSEYDGYIFMPLYQKLGNDGFFIIHKIKWFWLSLSVALRKIRFHRLVQLLPGVDRHKGQSHTLTVNTRIAKWYVIEFFHLMGFRLKLKEGERIIFTKREFDVTSP